MSRTLAREDAFKLIFEMNITGAEPQYVLDYLKSSIGGDNEMWAQNHLSSDNFRYINEIVNSVYSNREKINDAISQKLNKWTIERISKVSLSILQLAVGEILYFDSIPAKVSANEAVELAKKYGENESPSFVNGVIGSILKDSEVNS